MIPFTQRLTSAKSTLLLMALLSSLFSLGSCIDDSYGDDYGSDQSGGKYNGRQGSCTYTDDPNEQMSYQWDAVEAAWDNYQRRLSDGSSYAEQESAYDVYVDYYNSYSDLIKTWQSHGSLTGWYCTPWRL